MEDEMKIDISSLIGDLVEDTIKSISKEKSSTLSEKIRAYSGGKPKTNKKDEKYFWYRKKGTDDIVPSTDANAAARGYEIIEPNDDVAKKIPANEKPPKQDADTDQQATGDDEETPEQPTTGDGQSAPDPDAADDETDVDGIGDELGDEGGEEEKEYNKEEAEAKLSEAGFTDGKVPDDVNESDPSIQEACDNGYKTNEETGYKPAPGNAGSLMNEVFSTVGVNMIRAMSPPTPTAEQLAEEITRVYGKTAAIQGINEKVREEQVLIAAQAALAKNTVVNEVIENNPNLSENSEVLSYYGSGTSLQQQYDLIQEMKKNKDTKLYDDKGNEITGPPNDFKTVRQILGWTNPATGEKFTAEEAKALVENQTKEGALEYLSLAALNGGGGGNPSDTAHIIRDGDNLTFMGYSDKQTLGDQQANSTPAQLLSEYKETVNYLKSIGYVFPKKEEQEINKQISKMEKEFADAERELARASLSPAREMADQMLDGGENSEAIMAVINDPEVAGEGGSKNADGRRKYIDNIKENAAVATVQTFRPIEVEKDDIPTWGEYLKDAGVKEGEEPTQEQKVAAMLLMRADETEVTVKIDGKETTMPRGQLFASGHSSRIMGELTQRLQKKDSGYSVDESSLGDYGDRLAEARQKSIEVIQSGIEKLNEFPIEDEEGDTYRMGDVMAGADLVDKLHLYAIDGNEAPGLYGQGMIRMIAGPHIVDEESLRECTGADSSEDLIKMMRARPPVEEGPTLPGSNLRESQLQRARVSQSPARTRGGDYVYLTKDDKYWYGKDDDKQKPKGAKQLGRITGQKAIVFFRDKDGNEREIGIQTFRSKTGEAGKLGTSYLFSKDMQECLAGKNKD